VAMMEEIKASIDPEPIFSYWDVFLRVHRPFARLWDLTAYFGVGFGWHGWIMRVVLDE